MTGGKKEMSLTRTVPRQSAVSSDFSRRGDGPDSASPVRLFVLARHAESSANIARVLSSDPARSVGLTARGRAQARQLGVQLANVDIDLAVGTSFLRTQQTIAIALHGRRVPVMIDSGFDEIRAGDLDGKPIETYWSWVGHHAGNERFPCGESLDAALLRYASALRRLLSRAEPITLLVIHEFALRRITEAATTSSSLTMGSALPYLFDERAIEQAAAGLEKLAQSDLAGSPAGPALRGLHRGARPGADRGGHARRIDQRTRAMAAGLRPGSTL
jgi:broad specificity phosphatase PhoE